MSEAEIQFPDVNYGPANKEKMRELTTSEWSPFFGKAYWEVFIFSMGYAYARGLKPKKVPGTGTMPARVFVQETRHLMRSLAIDHAKKVGKPDCFLPRISPGPLNFKSCSAILNPSFVSFIYLILFYLKIWENL